MARTAERKLTSQERCEKAFISALKAIPDGSLDPKSYEEALAMGWTLCWKYLESRVEEYVKS